MFVMRCYNCGKNFAVQQIVGTLPPNVPLNSYCSEECLTNKHNENFPPKTDGKNLPTVLD